MAGKKKNAPKCYGHGLGKGACGRDLGSVRKRWAIVILSLLVAATAVTIFCFSAQNAKVSSAVSGQVTEWLLRAFRPGFADLSRGEQQALIAQYSHTTRKAAHFTEFLLLGLFLRLLLQWLRVKWKTGVSWALGTLYAVTDEFHQMAVSGRAAMARDVLIDSAGVLFGVLLAAGIGYLSRRKKRKAAGLPGGAEGKK